MTRKAVGPNGVAITRSDDYPTDDDLVDRAMQVGHLTLNSILANRTKLFPQYALMKNYQLDPEKHAEDMWFEVAEDIADQYQLSFDGIAWAFHEKRVVCMFGGEKFMATTQSDRADMHRAIISTLKTHHRI